MKTPYEIINDKKPTLKYFHVFGTKCFVLKDGNDRRGKFETKTHEAIFLGYSRRSYRVFVVNQQQLKESVNVTFDDTKLPKIQTEDPSESLKFNDLSDSDSEDENQPEVSPEERNEIADNLGGDGGNIDNGDTTTTQGESS